MGTVLTDRQIVAAASEHRLVNIVSAPGSGKTTIAAERVGYLRHTRRDRQRGVLALSFTRSAVGELRQRIIGRWGSRAGALPSLITTFDDFHVRALHHLLRKRMLTWPGGLVELEVLDTYQGVNGYRWLLAGSYRRHAAPDTSGLVTSKSTRIGKPQSGIGSAADHRAALEAGRVSHEDVRRILLAALGLDGVKEELKSWLAASFSAMVIDEVYDADRLDLSVAYLAAEEGLDVTLVGDPWQALYEWRGATPEKVTLVLDAFPFTAYEQPESFRFTGNQMPGLASALRESQGVQVPTTTSGLVDVAIGRHWARLWTVGDNVLPLAFRTVQNATDAMLNLLLDEVTKAALGRPSFGKQTAYTVLRVDPETAEQSKREFLLPVLSALREGADARDVLELLRAVALAVGAGRRPSRLGETNERERIAEIDRLRTRLGHDDLIPGLTVHQAKGCEWDRVGVALTAAEEGILSQGLRPLEQEHCVLYVALTRARRYCGSLRPSDQLGI